MIRLCGNGRPAAAAADCPGSMGMAEVMTFSQLCSEHGA